MLAEELTQLLAAWQVAQINASADVEELDSNDFPLSIEVEQPILVEFLRLLDLIVA
jgi:hypothetical protein